MIAPIPVSLTNDTPRFSAVALSCDRYWQCCFTARRVASLSFLSAKSLTRSWTCVRQDIAVSGEWGPGDKYALAILFTSTISLALLLLGRPRFLNTH